MSEAKKGLAEKIDKLSIANWKQKSTPLLLSQLGCDINAEGINYKDILGGQGLRNFISTDVPGQTIATHPSQYAKVGIHPATEKFSYDDAPTDAKPEPSEVDKLRKSRRAFYGFIEAISELPPEEIDGISLPARVIVRLLEGK